MKTTKKLSVLLALPVLLFTMAGCHEKKEPAPAGKPAAPPPLPAVNANTTTPETVPAAAASTVSAEPVAPELAPIQQGIDSFQAKNNRLPYNVDELVEQKIIPKPPALPPGKIYYIDHASGRIRIGNGP